MQGSGSSGSDCRVRVLRLGVFEVSDLGCRAFRIFQISGFGSSGNSELWDSGRLGSIGPSFAFSRLWDSRTCVCFLGVSGLGFLGFRV